ncbi:tRNA methyltransferase, has a role in tRNA modification [Coemansia sp. RSA 1086]|nr:tRNA methyltransferase, has a role in tRNA modification [Coemansia sp. RSA 1086]
MKDPIPDQLTLKESEKEAQYVHEVYDQIASHFSDTRFKPWPVIEKYLLDQPAGSIGVDVGCGNGKYLRVRTSDIFMMGTDRSSSLIDICCTERNLECLISDALDLPYRNSCFDFAISIAVIHHFSSPDRRLQAVKELLRVVREGGTVLIFAWALEQKGRRKFDQNSQDFLVPWVVPGSRNLEQSDKVFHRYYHLFREGELVELVQQAGGCSIVQSGYDKDNCTIHKSARQSNGSIASILDAIDDIVKQVQPQQLLFLSIDGVPPRLKERLQRERRARPQPIVSESGADPAFSTYFVTPGTKWMRQLESHICKYISEKRRNDQVWRNLQVVFSGCRDPGEGEQKIIEFIRQRHKQQHRHVVWSNDADTVLLALSAHVPSVTVVSERSRGSSSTYSVVDVDKLRQLIFQRYAPQMEPGALQNTERIVDDLVFMTFFIGNDFVPPLSPARNSAADDGSCIEDIWSLYSTYWTECHQYLHNRGSINPDSLKVLLQILVRDREEKQFRQYVGVTQLGPKLTATRARRIEWDIQRRNIEQGPSSSQSDERKPLHTKRIKSKHGKTKKGKTRGSRSIAKGGRYIPYVWTGNVAELNVEDIAQATGAAPLPVNTYPIFAPPKTCTDGIMLKLANQPLLSLEMVPLYSWVLQAVALRVKLSMAGISEPINLNKVVWLGMLAQRFSMELVTYDMDDEEFKSIYKRWKHMRSDPQPQEQAVLADTPSGAPKIRPSMLLVLERQHSEPTTPPLQSNVVSVVNDRDWDVLLADATTDYERQLKYEDWKCAFYWHSSSSSSSSQTTPRERLCGIYANALGWTAQYFFAGTVSSWEFSWPEDLPADLTGIAPLASDLLQTVLQMSGKWTAVPVSSSLPPLLKEHLLSVLPQDAWSSLNDHDRKLARLLFKSNYTDKARTQVHDHLADTTKDVPLVNIWM